MIESILVYGLLSILMVIAGKYSGKHNQCQRKHYPGLYMFIPCLLFAFVFGCRYNVGVDYMSYLDGYNGTYHREHEIGFSFIESFLAGINAHFAYFFGLFAFLQISFFVSAFKERAVFPYLIFTLIIGTGCLTWMNGIRQAVATCVFVYSIQFISERKLIPYLVCCSIAFLFHKSSLLLIPFYFIPYLDLSKRQWVPWGIFVLALFVKYSNVGMYIEMIVSPVSSLFKYDEFYDIENIMDTIEAKAGGTGLGVILQDIIYIFIILLIPKLRIMFDTQWMRIVITLFLIGMFGVVAFPGQVLLRRPFGYFTVFSYILIAYSLYLLFQLNGTNKMSKVWGWLLVATQLLMFAAVVLLRGDDNLCAFHFFWDS